MLRQSLILYFDISVGILNLFPLTEIFPTFSIAKGRFDLIYDGEELISVLFRDAVKKN